MKADEDTCGVLGQEESVEVIESGGETGDSHQEGGD
jgi:hypothetical protein